MTIVAKIHAMASSAGDVIGSHPVSAVGAGIASVVIGFLQSSQEVASTLIALVTSLAGLLTVLLAMRKAWRNRDKE